MEKYYTAKRILKDGTVKVYSYPKTIKGNGRPGPQKATKTKIVEILRELSPDQLKTVLEYVETLSQSSTESEELPT